MLRVTFPDNRRAERSWICAVMLGEFLGLPHEIAFAAQAGVRIAAEGRALELPDTFFSAARDNWLAAATLPSEPLRRRTAEALGCPDARLIEPTLPILYGVRGNEWVDDGNAWLSLDVFGSAFFMLTRYEEAATEMAGAAGAESLRDRHERFPASASLAWREDFLHRPLIDEYAEVLWSALLRRWPRLKRKARQPRMLVSCDVDHPYHPGATSLARMVKRTAGELLRRRGIPAAVAPLRNYLAGRRGDWRHDPYYHTVDWIMDINEAAGNRVAFYFIPEITDKAMDDTCPISDRAVRAMMKRIADRGHEIGVHPGYRTYLNAARLRSGRERLQRVLDQEGIWQQIAGGRQHYLRWSTRTPALWNEAGMSYDSTLGYADQAGFRCGTSREYPMFDLHAGTALRLKQRPLACMDCSIVSYMGLGFTSRALEKMRALKHAAQRMNGDFSLLWHNSFLDTAAAREIYREIVAR